ncbi:hypothetical protein ABK249_22675 [Neorhizobium sp. Rsf11]|uniref:Uncharacterized protein n=1 Tax=Neorhizobium phenanthreniclasticum TaxID=3157917 RepID=A0ABV0M768_9HYPH
MTVTKVKAHTRGVPDPFTPVFEARRKDFALKWGVELLGANDDRLAAPVADPVAGPGRVTVESIKRQLKDIARMIGGQG